MIGLPVSLSSGQSAPVTVDYAFVSGSAKAATDYIGAAGSLTFAPGTTTVNIPLGIKDDFTAEGIVSSNWRVCYLVSVSNATERQGLSANLWHTSGCPNLLSKGLKTNCGSDRKSLTSRMGDY